MNIREKIYKTSKLFFFNIIITIILLFVLDFIASFITIKYENLNLRKKQNFIKLYLSKFSKKDENDAYIFNKQLRPVENINSKKKPILIFGCSYAYNNNLNYKESFSSQLGKATKRPVYNRAYSGWATQHMLYQLQNDKFYQIIPKPEYIIYVFIPKHITRLYFNDSLRSYNYSLFYKKNKTNTLERDYLNEILNNNTTVYLIKKKIFKKVHNKKVCTSNDMELLKLHLLEAKKAAISHWGNDIKFVVILYEKNKKLGPLIPMFKYLEKQNFIIININDLDKDKDFFTPKYQIGNGKNNIYTHYDNHPGTKAWEEITPLIVKKLNL